MNEKQKLEGFLVNLGLTYEKISESGWLINDKDQGIEGVFVFLESPVVIVRSTVMSVPEHNREKFYETVLKLNVDGLVYVAYALEGDKLILSNSFLIETLDLEELQAAFDDIGVALTQHFPVLSQFKHN